MKSLKKYRSLFVVIPLYLMIFIFKREVFYLSLKSSLSFLIEMFKVLPPVMIITSLISIWIPASIIDKNLGNKSGIKGVILSLLTGALSTGPIYAAFPGVLILYKKGASVKNMVIILSSWAVIKIPMLFVESSFLGIKFTILRFLITVPIIIVISLIIDRLVKRDEIKESVTEINLPNINCTACGYGSCEEFKIAIRSGKSNIKECRVLSK